MNVAIIGGELNPKNYALLDQELNKLIEEKQCYLFNVLCGGTSMGAYTQRTLGKFWADRNGAPVHWIFEPTPAALQDKLLKKADYIIFMYDGNQAIKNLIMKYKMMGKHGSVINIGD